MSDAPQLGARGTAMGLAKLVPETSDWNNEGNPAPESSHPGVKSTFKPSQNPDYEYEIKGYLTLGNWYRFSCVDSHDYEGILLMCGKYWLKVSDGGRVRLIWISSIVSVLDWETTV